MTPFNGNPTIGLNDLPDPSDYEAFYPFIKGVFSQWHQTPFELDGHQFVTAEQWMMYSKAKLFGDEDRALHILNTNDPSLQKRLGSLVTDFDQLQWDKWKIDIVYRGSYAKFSQNKGAARQLKSTGETMLVEANVRDWVWGIGLGVEDPQVCNPSNWRGTNLLGRILTLVKARFELR